MEFYGGEVVIRRAGEILSLTSDRRDSLMAT
jgi:hypothetical protein